MCDTLVIVADAERGRGDGRDVFVAKNSDRDANEAQFLDWRPAKEHRAGSSVRCTWVEVPQARSTHAVLLSRPFWMWGAEMGTNEHGLWIGNEAVFTRQPYRKTGLTGMDLLRLALERARDRDEAVRLIARFLDDPGQGGGCGYEDRGFTYHNSFLLADPAGATVLETAGTEWATEDVSGARTISNGLTIDGFARRHGRRLETAVAAAEARRCRTQERADALASGFASGESARSDVLAGLMASLRDHGPRVGPNGPSPETPRYRWLNGSLVAPCMHGGGLVASSVTTASWVGRLAAASSGGQHWATATSSPCLSLFKPVAVDQRLDDPPDDTVLGPRPSDVADEASLWWRHERLHRRILADPVTLGAGLRRDRDALEKAWLNTAPSSADAFAAHHALLDRLQGRLVREATEARDVRPWWARRYWRLRSRAM